jgi:peptidoglycan/LPS O-acetylase OafA/YrhL
MTFYLAVPIWAAVAARRGLTTRAEVFVLVGLGLSSVVLRRLIISGAPDHGYLLYTLPSSFLWFVPGMLLALLVVNRPDWKIPRMLASGWSWAAIMAAAFTLLCTGLPFDLAFPAAAVVGGGAVAACVLLQLEGRPVRWLQHRALLLLGAVSYSLYLLHYPIVRWWADDHRAFAAIVVVMLPAVLALAWLSYRLLEAPSQNFGRRWSQRPTTKPAGGGTAVLGR